MTSDNRAKADIIFQQDAAPVLNANARINASLKQINATLRGMKGSADSFGGGLDRALDSGVEKAFALGAAMTAAGLAVDLVTGAIQKLNEAQREGAEFNRTEANALGSLAQLSAGDQQKFDELVSASEQTFAEGGTESFRDAADLTFNLESAGLLSERKFASMINSVDNASELASGAGTVISALGRRETGGLRQLVSKSFAIAGPTPNVSPSEVLGGVADIAGLGGQLGLSDEELFAFLGGLTGTTGNVRRAATQARAIFAGFLREGFDRDESVFGDLPAMIQNVQDRGLSGKELITLLTQEGASGFTQENLNRFQSFLPAAIAANESDLGSAALDNAFSEPRLRAARMELAEGNQTTLQRSMDGTLRNLSNAAIDAQMRDSGIVDRWVQGAFWAIAQRLPFGDSFVVGNRANDPVFREQNPELSRNLLTTRGLLAERKASVESLGPIQSRHITQIDISAPPEFDVRSQP